MDRDAVIARIAAAFDGVSRAGGVSLHESEVLDWDGPPKARADARLLDTDTRWQVVSDADIKKYHDSMYFMDAIGFRYYLPAFLIYALRHLSLDIRNDEQQVMDVVFFILAVKEYTGTLHTETRQIMTPAQVQAVGGFLRYVAEHGDEYDREDAVRAFRDYWNDSP